MPVLIAGAVWRDGELTRVRGFGNHGRIMRLIAQENDDGDDPTRATSIRSIAGRMSLPRLREELSAKGLEACLRDDAGGKSSARQATRDDCALPRICPRYSGPRAGRHRASQGTGWLPLAETDFCWCQADHTRTGGLPRFATSRGEPTLSPDFSVNEAPVRSLFRPHRREPAW